MRTPPCALPSLLRRAGARRRAGLAATIAGTVAGVALVATTVGSAPAGAATVTPSATTRTVTVTWRGNGHGHGMSQYGARGAAMAGLSAAQIINFYYPHTSLVRQKTPNIRVLLSGFGTAPTVSAWTSLTVTGVPGRLPVTGVAQYRLVADAGTGLVLQQLLAAKGARWTIYRTGLPNQAAFSRGWSHPVQVLAPDGTSNYYQGEVRAVRTTARGTGPVNTVNYVSLERYVAGVAPREMPASWAQAAVDAQAIAARTYAQYALDHPRSTSWDICDTTACQFYGGNAYLDKTGTMVWKDDTRGVNDTSNLVAQYRGAAILAQFSASNGGWTVDGGLPYLVAKADPYDNAASGDPYLAETARLSLSSLAAAYGLTRITRITTATDGHGAYGGRTTSATISGVRAGKAVTVSDSGFGLADNLGAWTNWFQITLS